MKKNESFQRFNIMEWIRDYISRPRSNGLKLNGRVPFVPPFLARGPVFRNESNSPRDAVAITLRKRSER